MGVMNCADNTGDMNLAIMTVKGIGGRLNKITVTRFDVMCVFREEGQACAQEECDVQSIFIYYEDNAEVIVKGEMKDSAITRPVSQVHIGEVSRQVNMIEMDGRQDKDA